MKTIQTNVRRLFVAGVCSATLLTALGAPHLSPQAHATPRAHAARRSYFGSSFRNIHAPASGNLNAGQPITVDAELWAIGLGSYPLKNADMYAYGYYNGVRQPDFKVRTDNRGFFLFNLHAPQIAKKTQVRLYIEFRGQGNILGNSYYRAYTIR